MNRRLTSLLPLMLPLMLALPASAQKLADPTRPPALMAAPESETATEGVAAGPRLQSILIGRAPDGRRLAVIDGATLRIGGKVGDAVLERINDNSVVLRRGKTLETLTLFPKPAEAADPTGKNK
ncbi:hypothetical protein RugamoR64_27690 [Duganella rhizosphaerae]